MYIVSSFQFSAYIELAITELEQKGIAKDKILVVPLAKRTEQRKILDTINQSDGISSLDTGAILGVIFMTLGTIYGYVLKWGPIIWGLIGLITGIILGLIIDLIPKRKNRKKNKTNCEIADVVLIINCNNVEAGMIENILWDNQASAVGRYEKNAVRGSSSCRIK